MDSIEYEALKRAQEMQRNQGGSHQTAPRSNPQQNPKKSQQTQRESHSTQTSVQTNSSQKESSFCEASQNSAENCPTANMPFIFEDKEKLLILVLVMLLCSEDSTDPALILALLYIII